MNDELIENGYTSGWAYGLGRDPAMRPIMLLSFRRLIDAKIDFDTMLTLFDILTAHTLENGTFPGKVETYNVIVDCKDVGFFELPVTSFVGWTLHM